MKKARLARTTTRKHQSIGMAEPSPLHENEWNFDGVPDDEIEVCFLYEYGRTAEAFTKLVDEFRVQNPEVVPKARALLTFCAKPIPFKTVPLPGNAGLKTCEFSSLADRRRAEERGKAWTEWLAYSRKAGQPGGFPGDDPRRFLFYLPPFPKKAWQEIDSDYRRLAAQVLMPELLLSGSLHVWLLLASKDFTEQMDAQEVIQAAVGAPMDKPALAAHVRRQLQQHILAPALIEQSEGIKQGVVGTLPPGFYRGKRRDQTYAKSFCRETVTFVINWARPDGEILDALKHWLESPDKRPHGDFKVGNVTSAREHLRKLGALRILETGLTAEQACDTDPKTGREFCTLYKSPDEYRRARLQASKVLKNQFPSADT